MAEAIALFVEDEGRGEALRRLEAVLFASAAPLSEDDLAERLPSESDLATRLTQLQTVYANRGVNLVNVAGGWAFRTAPDLSHLLAREREEERRLSRAALETLAIIAYHQPVTRVEIEEVRGVAVAKGTLDILLASGWIRLRGRRRSPGRPVTFGTTDAFLEAFGLAGVADLPGLDDLVGAGLLEGTPPEGFAIPSPRGGAALEADEDPLDEDESGEAGEEDEVVAGDEDVDEGGDANERGAADEGLKGGGAGPNALDHANRRGPDDAIGGAVSADGDGAEARGNTPHDEDRQNGHAGPSAT